MKKFIAFISAFMLCISAFSCSKKSEKQEKERSFAAEKMNDTAYRKESLKLPDGLSMIYCVEAFDNCSKYLIVGAASDGVGFWIADPDFTSFTKVDIPDLVFGASYMLDAANDGTIVTFVNDVSYGDLPAPDPSSADYSEEEYNAAAEYKFRIIAYSPDGKKISDNEVRDFPVMPDQMTHLSECASDGKTVIINIDGNFEVFSVDGAYIGSLSAGKDETVENIGKNSDGKLVAAVRIDTKNIQLREVTEKGELKKSSVTYELSETVYGVIEPGWGDYTMFIRSMTTIYGIRSGDGSIVPLFNVNKAGLNSSNFSNFAMCSDGIFAVPVTNYSNWSCRLKRFLPCDPSELENIPTLTIGVNGRNFPIEDYMEFFNDENENYQIELRSYGGESGDPDLAEEEIQQDALSGSLPDIIVSNGLNGMIGGFNTVKMEVVCDLYDFMDKDDTLTRDALVPSLREHIDHNFDNHTYFIPSSFALRLPYTIKSEFAGDIKEWDFNAYIDMLEDPPAGMSDEYKNREETQWERMVIEFDDYLDYENLTCSFDSPDFIRALEYAYEGVPDNRDEYSSGEETDQDAAQRSYNYEIRENRRLFTDGYIFDYKGYIDFTRGTFGGEPFTILGKPNSGSNNALICTNDNCYGITKTSENKELAWEFIKHMLSDDYITNHYLTENYHWGHDFVPTVSGMKLLEEYAKLSYENIRANKWQENIKDYTGCVFNTWTKDEKGNYIFERLGNVDDEVIAEVNELIASAQPQNESYIYAEFSSEQTSVTYGIFNEEVKRFFHGECSAEECAKMIQNRISIYISEQFG